MNDLCKGKITIWRITLGIYLIISLKCIWIHSISINDREIIKQCWISSYILVTYYSKTSFSLGNFWRNAKCNLILKNVGVVGHTIQICSIQSFLDISCHFRVYSPISFSQSYHVSHTLFAFISFCLKGRCYWPKNIFSWSLFSFAIERMVEK